MCDFLDTSINFSLTNDLFLILRLATMIQTCNRNDPNLNACVTRSVELLRPALTYGEISFKRINSAIIIINPKISLDLETWEKIFKFQNWSRCLSTKF